MRKIKGILALVAVLFFAGMAPLAAEDYSFCELDDMSIDEFRNFFGKADDIIKYVTLIVWIVVTVVTLISIIGELSSVLALHWLLVLAKNALIIGGILTIKNGK